MRLGILNCGRAPEVVSAVHGEYLEWFDALLGPHGFALQMWDAEQMELPNDVYEADAWLITGSKHAAYEMHDFIPPLEDFIRDIHAAHVPLVGICFGHQLIAQAMGGKVELFEDGWEFGRRAYQTEALGEVYLNACHQDQVVELPPGAEIIATSDGCPVAGFRLGETCVTLQPHPEIDPVILAEYVPHHRANTATMPKAMIDTAQADLSAETHEAEVGAWLAEVLQAR